MFILMFFKKIFIVFITKIYVGLIFFYIVMILITVFFFFGHSLIIFVIEFTDVTCFIILV